MNEPRDGRQARKPKRAPRPSRPDRTPLDDGRREGTDPWRDVRGVRFCHWDRWLLRLAVGERDGLAAIVSTLRRRIQTGGDGSSTAEPLLAQANDLAARLAALGLGPADVLDEAERTSEWLREKAFRRVWEARSLRATEAMRRTPRLLFEERARRGNWSSFAVSPAPYEAELAALMGDGSHDWRATSLFVELLAFRVEGLLARAATAPERIAIHRATLSVAIDAMERFDDSGAEIAELFREHERAYLDLVRTAVDREPLLRDLIELASWEDYGLFERVEPFLRTLPEPDADFATRELARLIGDLRAPGLARPLERARALRKCVLASAAALDDELGTP